jgi:hypothetical protein
MKPITIPHKAPVMTIAVLRYNGKDVPNSIPAAAMIKQTCAHSSGGDRNGLDPSDLPLWSKITIAAEKTSTTAARVVI